MRVSVGGTVFVVCAVVTNDMEVSDGGAYAAGNASQPEIESGGMALEVGAATDIVNKQVGVVIGGAAAVDVVEPNVDGAAPPLIWGCQMST